MIIEEPPLALTLANITEEYAKTLLGFFARAPTSTMQQIIKSKRANYNRYGRGWLLHYPKMDIDVELACLLLACREIYMAYRSLQYKDKRGREEILEADRLMAELRRKHVSAVARKPRRKPKLEAVNVRLPLIMALRDRGCAWREICVYLAKYAGLKVTHTYLRESVLTLAGPTSVQDNAE